MPKPLPGRVSSTAFQSGAAAPSVRPITPKKYPLQSCAAAGAAIASTVSAMTRNERRRFTDTLLSAWPAEPERATAKEVGAGERTRLLGEGLELGRELLRPIRLAHRGARVVPFPCGGGIERRLQ